jgi:hypothetical protein
MQILKPFSVFEQDIQLKTKTFQGTPHFPVVSEYIGLMSKNLDSGSMTEIDTFLRRKAKADAPTNSVAILNFMKETLETIKTAQPDVYAKVGGDVFISKVEAITPK